MAGIIDFPTVVQVALDRFGDLLPNEPQRRHCAEYLTGLFVAERKNVSGINREFAQTTDQSCLNASSPMPIGTGILQSFDIKGESTSVLTSCKAEVSHDPFAGPVVFRDVVHGPRQGRAQGFPEDRPTGLADGRQPLKGPVIRMALPQLSHPQAVRQQGEVHVPRLALRVPPLTIPQPQLLHAIPTKGLCSSP